MLPNLFLAGFPKCGSTSLYNSLSKHPDVFPSTFEESPVFSHDSESGSHLHLLEMDQYPGYAGERYILNGHPVTILSERALKSIKHHVDNPKFVVSLRDPIRRTISNYNYMRYKFFENRSINEVLEAEFDRETGWLTGYSGGPLIDFHYHASNYGPYLENLAAMFGWESIKVVQFESFFDPHLRESQITDLMGFLGIDPFDTEAVHSNPARPTEAVLAGPNRIRMGGKNLSFERAVFCRDTATKKVERVVLGPSDHTWNWFTAYNATTTADLATVQAEHSDKFNHILEYVADRVSPSFVDTWRALDARGGGLSA
jgi:hypothetical protein